MEPKPVGPAAGASTGQGRGIRERRRGYGSAEMSTARSRRQSPGGMPVAFLNARLNTASES